MTNVLALRPFQSAKARIANPQLYRAVVRAIKSDQEAGKSGFAPLYNARQPAPQPEPAA